MNEKSTNEYWNERVRNTPDLKEVVYAHQGFDDFNERTRSLLSLFKGKIVCDIGCGYGRLSELFDIEKYVGVDFSEEMIKKAKELYPDKYFQLFDVNIGFLNKKFDVIFECMCLSSLDLTSEEFRDKYKDRANIVITIEPDEFRIYYL